MVNTSIRQLKKQVYALRHLGNDLDNDKGDWDSLVTSTANCLQKYSFTLYAVHTKKRKSV